MINTLIRRLIAVALVASFASATAAHAKIGHPPSLFFARPDGDRGIAIAYDRATGAEWARFPVGVLSADSSLFVSAAFIGDNDTQLITMDASTGEQTLCMPLQGRWALSAVSPSGQFVAVTRVASEGNKHKQMWTKSGKWQTEVMVMDTVSRRPKHTLKLDGNFEAEAISASGTSLFLVEHLPAAKPDHYAIRWYDLKNERLIADPLRSKTADEIMSGYAWGGTASADGDWLFTLYVSTNRKAAFIHMLNTREGFTVCVDLPSVGQDGKGDFEALKGYTLAYSPLRQTVYAMNPSLGTAAEVKLGDYKLNGNKFVANRVTNFKPDMSLKDAATVPPAHSTVSNDDGLIYFAQGKTAYAYDPTVGMVRQYHPADSTITGLGTSVDGKWLMLARQDAAPVVLDAGSGKAIFAGGVQAARDACVVTKPTSFVPPNRKPDLHSGDFWYGSAKLWTSLNETGAWSTLPFDGAGFSQKVFWWREGYDWQKEPQPNLVVTGKRLDAPAPPMVGTRATNAFAGDIGSAMLVGISIPTAGCWEVTGQYGDAKLSFVVWVGL